MVLGAKVTVMNMQNPSFYDACVLVEKDKTLRMNKKKIPAYDKILR